MEKVALLLLAFALAAPVAHAHMELDLLTPDGNLYPGCEVEARPLPENCPYRLQIEGWDVYLSSLILTDAAIGIRRPSSIELDEFVLGEVLAFLDKFSLRLRLIGQSNMLFSSGYARRLKERGVSFYIAPTILSEDGAISHVNPEDKYAFCRLNGGCYSSTRKMVQLTTPHSMKTLVHELAHAWHHLVVPDGFDNQCIKDAYEFSVVRDQIYNDFVIERYGRSAENPELNNIVVRKAYAAKNVREYFAELFAYFHLGITPGLGGSQVLPYRDRHGMYEVDRNGYFVIDSLRQGGNCGQLLNDGETFWPE